MARAWLAHIVLATLLPGAAAAGPRPDQTARAGPAGDELPAFYETLYLVVNTTRAPLDDVRVRYALAMATDRRAIAAAMHEDGFEDISGTGLVPPYTGYRVLERLETPIKGRAVDVLAYDPASARELLAEAGYPGGVSKNGRKLAVDLLVYEGEDTDVLVRLLKEQWGRNLGIDVNAVRQPWHTYLKTKDARAFGVAIDGRALMVSDASELFDFATGMVSRAPAWSDPTFAEMLRQASRYNAPNRADRLRACEEYLLRRMPVIPLLSRRPSH